MGIHGLSKLLSDEAPDCMKEVDLDSLTGRKVAVDASMAMYQFLVSTSYEVYYLQWKEAFFFWMRDFGQLESRCHALISRDHL